LFFAAKEGQLHSFEIQVLFDCRIDDL